MDVKFVDGLIVKEPRQGAPEFIKMTISIKREDLIKWLSGETKEWLNLDVKKSKKGSLYAQVNEWEPQSQQGATQGQPQAPKEQEIPVIQQEAEEVNIDDVPF